MLVLRIAAAYRFTFDSFERDFNELTEPRTRRQSIRDWRLLTRLNPHAAFCEKKGESHEKGA